MCVLVLSSTWSRLPGTGQLRPRPWPLLCHNSDWTGFNLLPFDRDWAELGHNARCHCVTPTPAPDMTTLSTREHITSPTSVYSDHKSSYFVIIFKCLQVSVYIRYYPHPHRTLVAPAWCSRSQLYLVTHNRLVTSCWLLTAAVKIHTECCLFHEHEDLRHRDPALTTEHYTRIQ